MSKLAAGLLLMIGIASRAGAATSSKLEPPDLSRYLRWGPLRARPAVELTQLGYDDNILLGSNADEARRVGDYTATVSPKLDALMLFGHRAFFAYNGALGYTAYLHHSQQNFLNQYHTGRFTLPLGRFGLIVDGGYTRAKDRPADLEQVRIDRRERRLGFGGVLELGWRTEVELTTSRSRYDYDNPNAAITAERLDRRTREDRLQAGYRVKGRTRVTFELSRRALEFDNPLLFGGAPVRRDGESLSLLPGLELGEGGTLTGTLRVGHGSVQAEDPRLADLSLLVGDAQLAYRPTPRNLLRLELHRQLQFAVYENNPYYIDSSGRAGALHYFTRLLGLEGATTRGRLTFPGSEVGSSRADEYVRYELGLRLRLAETTLGRRLEYTLGVQRYRRNSSIDILDSSQTTFGVGAIVGY